MTDLQIEIIKHIVNTFCDLAHINNQEVRDNLITRLSSMNEQDVIDYLVVSLGELAGKGTLKVDDILDNIDVLTCLSEKYPTGESLIERLNWLKAMNLTHPDMPIQENHKLVLETFDKFNQLIGTRFDAYYTGGLMGYLATNHKLERYHGDLDLFINEEQLNALCELTKQSNDFEFISNMNNKEQNGHEFKIQYKGTPMSIGLFLFERTKENGMIIKEYYHKDNNPENELLVNQQHLDPEYAKLSFSDQIREHDGIPYKMQSLESIYNSKKGSRPKDKYDADIIKDNIDVNVEEEISRRKKDTKKEVGLDATNSVVANMEKKLNEPNTGVHL